MGDFFAFRKMVTLPLMRIVYVVGVVVIAWAIISDASQVARTQSLFRMGPGNPFAPMVPTSSPWPSAILTLIAAQVGWRVACEGVVVVFSIFESLRRIEERE